MRCGERHKKLMDGKGLCSVPMWMDGVPAGFCDAAAYGKPTPENRFRYEGYVPFLACPGHGGPDAPKQEADND